ncbi:MAG: type II toxin-antitoxin system RelE/ParE family toxin [Lachnospiraceae bacterium]|nr:type II toxin-antitoxin system RelE/ParE family toxin [Lachnospiraceae bacterium]
MAYKLTISERADEMIYERVGYLINKLSSENAAEHLITGIESVYDRLEENPYQFPESKDELLFRLGYREALIPDMEYRLIFRIESEEVYIVAFFHELEDYINKLC